MKELHAYFKLLKRKQTLKYITVVALVNLFLWGSTTAYINSSSFNILKALENADAESGINTYKENFSDTASSAEFYKVEPGFEFKYKKSLYLNNAYAAIYFPIEVLDIDFSAYSTLQIELEPGKARRIPVFLSMHYDSTINCYLSSFIDVKEGVTKYELPITDFQIPVEWFENNNLQGKELPVRSFEHIFTISITSCHLLPKGIEDKYLISGIYLLKDNRMLLYGITAIDLLFMVFYTLFFVGLFQKKKEVIHIPIQPTTSFNKESVIDKCCHFIALNYSNADLTLKDLQKEIGINGQDLSKEIKKQFDLSFPQYLNMVRIEEAKRLLLENKEAAISDIAYRVGFNSPNNFNRVFKNIVGLTPKEYVYSIDK